jgi:hypothetical protein
MSIIYDALKKVEDKDKSPLAKGKKKPFILFLCLVVIVIGFTIVFIVFKLPPKKQIASITGQKALKDKIKAPAAAELETQDKYSPEGALTGNYVLEGIIYDQEAPVAIINGTILREKDKIGKAEIIKINPDSVELLNLEDNTVFTLIL